MRFALALSLATASFGPKASFCFHPVANRLTFTKNKSFKVATIVSMSTTSEESAIASTSIGAVGSKLTDVELAKEALSKFFDSVTDIQLEPTTGGVNNIVQYVTLPNGDKELLRIYNNGCDEKRVQFEHEILKQLNDMKTDLKLSFDVPDFLSSRDDPTKTMVRLSNGADACMCKIIPGTLPKLTCAKDLGRAAGELNTALTNVKIDKARCNTAPYWQMWKVHHAVTRENFAETIKGPLFDEKRDAADRMLEEILAITDRCETTYQSLQVQLIHGDLHYDNVLVDADAERVTALLDFEFASFDWRALEIAIGLSKYAGEEPDAMPYFADYIDGYATTGKLSREEAEAIPDLINLRILSNIVYFVGRHLAQEDDISSITTRIENYARRVDWVKANGDKIVDRIIEKMKL